jgi:hypothetical protein
LACASEAARTLDPSNRGGKKAFLRGLTAGTRALTKDVSSMANRAFLFISTIALAACSDRTALVNGLDAGGRGGGEDSGGPAVTTHKIDRAHLSATGTTDALDYADPALWVCLPGNDPNECLDDLDSTEFLKDGTTKIVEHTVAKNPPFDCFYVYPTVALSGNGNMTDFSDISSVLDPLLAQGATFTSLCTLYAPLYRQVSLSVGGAAPADGGSTVSRAGDGKLAYGDVEAAFAYYMAHYNKGRKFVLMGHSQGTAMLTQLMVNKFDKDDALRKQLISALLIGGSIQVPVGKDVGGTFQNIPICTKPAQTGCVIAYDSFAAEAPPPANSLFGKPGGPGLMNACTSPSLLAGNTGRYRGSYFPVKFVNTAFKPDAPANPLPPVTTPFTLHRDMFSGECKNENGFSYLEVRPDPASDDKRKVPPYRTTGAESIGFGMHIADYSLERDDLIDAVEQQSKAALK